MVKLLAREAALVLLTGLFALYAVPVLLGAPIAPVLFGIGVMMALTFTAAYAIAVLSAARMKAPLRGWIGIFAWVFAFLGDLTLYGRIDVLGGSLSSAALYTVFAPALFGLALPALAALKSRPEGRAEAAGWAVYAYSLPMLMVRWLLLPLLGQSEALSLLALQGGGFYLALRVLVRIFWPFSVEGNENAPPLIRRPVPDQIVGLIEGTTRLRARPFATARDGARDEGAISVLCPPDTATEVVARIAGLLEGKPFDVSTGARVEGMIEVVVKPRS